MRHIQTDTASAIISEAQKKFGDVDSAEPDQHEVGILDALLPDAFRALNDVNDEGRECGGECTGSVSIPCDVFKKAAAALKKAGIE